MHSILLLKTIYIKIKYLKKEVIALEVVALEKREMLKLLSIRKIKWVNVYIQLKCIHLRCKTASKLAIK